MYIRKDLYISIPLFTCKTLGDPSANSLTKSACCWSCRFNFLASSAFITGWRKVGLVGDELLCDDEYVGGNRSRFREFSWFDRFCLTLNGVVCVLAWVDSAELREVIGDADRSAEVVLVGKECFSRRNCSAISDSIADGWGSEVGFEVGWLSVMESSDLCLSNVLDIELKDCFPVLSAPEECLFCSDWSLLVRVR